MPGFAPLGVLPLSAYPATDIRSQFLGTGTMYSNPSFIVYFATKDFITPSDDAPANTPIDGSLIRALSFQRSILGGSYGIGRLQSDFGYLEIITSDGSKDDLFDRYRPDGRRVMLKVMEAGGRLRDAITVFDGVGVRWELGRARGRVTVRGNSYKLDVPAQRSVYAGTGGLEGGSELAGKRRPWPLGYVKNIPGVLVIASENLYDINAGPIEAVTAVRDRGGALTFSANYATTALLRAASIPAGQYATCLAEGRVRIGGSPSTQIRFDVSGDKTGGSFVSKTADIVRRLVEGATIMTTAEMALETFSAVNAAQPADVGYYIHSESSDTVADCAGKLMETIGGWCGCQSKGKFYVGILLAPDASKTPDFDYREDEGDFVALPDRQPLPDFLSPPPTTWTMGWDRNWAKQDDIAGAVVVSNPSLATWLGIDSRYAKPSSVFPVPSGQAPKEAKVDGYFRNEVDAIAEATRRYQLYRQNFNLYTYRVKGPLFMHQIGQQVRITTASRFGLAGGRPLRTVSINDDTSTNTVELIGIG